MQEDLLRKLYNKELEFSLDFCPEGTPCYRCPIRRVCDAFFEGEEGDGVALSMLPLEKGPPRGLSP